MPARRTQTRSFAPLTDATDRKRPARGATALAVPAVLAASVALATLAAPVPAHACSPIYHGTTEVVATDLPACLDVSGAGFANDASGAYPIEITNGCADGLYLTPASFDEYYFPSAGVESVMLSPGDDLTVYVPGGTVGYELGTGPGMEAGSFQVRVDGEWGDCDLGPLGCALVDTEHAGRGLPSGWVAGALALGLMLVGRRRA